MKVKIPREAKNTCYQRLYNLWTEQPEHNKFKVVGSGVYYTLFDHVPQLSVDITDSWNIGLSFREFNISFEKKIFYADMTMDFRDETIESPHEALLDYILRKKDFVILEALKKENITNENLYLFHKQISFLRHKQERYLDHLSDLEHYLAQRHTKIKEKTIKLVYTAAAATTTTNTITI